MGGIQSVGIYASSSEVTIMALTEKGGKCRLTHFSQQEIPGSDFFNSKQTSSFQHLRTEFFSKKKGENNPVFFSFSPEPVVLRYFKMLKIPKREWGVAIRFEARKYIPFSMEKMESDFMVLPLEKNKNEMEVVLFAVERSCLEHLSLFLQEVGLTAQATETSWLSVLRLLKWNKQLRDKTNEGGILLSLEQDRLGIALFVSGVPYFSREVRWSSSIVDSSSPDIMESVAGEVRLAQEFHRKNFPEKSLTTLYSFGSWGSEKLNNQLSKECEITTIMVDPFLKIKGPLDFHVVYVYV